MVRITIYERIVSPQTRFGFVKRLKLTGANRSNGFSIRSNGVPNRSDGIPFGRIGRNDIENLLSVVGSGGYADRSNGMVNRSNGVAVRPDGLVDRSIGIPDRPDGNEQSQKFSKCFQSDR